MVPNTMTLDLFIWSGIVEGKRRADMQLKGVSTIYVIYNIHYVYVHDLVSYGTPMC